MEKIKVIKFYDNSNKYSGIEYYTQTLREIFNEYYKDYVFILNKISNKKGQYLKNVFLSQGNGIKSNLMSGFSDVDIVIVHDLFMLEYDYRSNDNSWNRFHNKIDRFTAYMKIIDLKLKNPNLISVSDYTKDVVYRKLKRDSIVFYPFKKAPELNQSKNFYRNYISKRYNIPENKIWIINISDLQIRKNIPFIQSLFKQLPDKYILIRIGQKIEGIDRQYNFMEISEEEKYYLIKSSDLFILPSLDEGFGAPVVEALSQKVPVVTSFMRVVKEISDEIPQLYTNSLNTENWVKFITKREYENMNMEKAYRDIQKFINKDKYIEFHKENFEKLRWKFKDIEYEITLW
jgi:glycosyltransferase involved in cell wall biosynthesis